jgi:hypothetical protein
VPLDEDAQALTSDWHAEVSQEPPAAAVFGFASVKLRPATLPATDQSGGVSV